MHYQVWVCFPLNNEIYSWSHDVRRWVVLILPGEAHVALFFHLAVTRCTLSMRNYGLVADLLEVQDFEAPNPNDLPRSKYSG